jgi:hypothetical protein
LYIIGTIGFISSTILTLNYLNTEDENEKDKILKYLSADLTVSGFFFLSGLSMDIAANFVIYSDRMGRPRQLKQLPSGGWTMGEKEKKWGRKVCCLSVVVVQAEYLVGSCLRPVVRTTIATMEGKEKMWNDLLTRTHFSHPIQD